MVVSGQLLALAALPSPGEEPWYPLNGRLGWPKSQSEQSWRREKSLAPSRIQAPFCQAYSKSLY